MKSVAEIIEEWRETLISSSVKHPVITREDMEAIVEYFDDLENGGGLIPFEDRR